MKKNKTNYIPEIDGLRAIAVISVVLFHAGFSIFSGGFVGVDVFFVISGFLITRLIIDEINETKKFNFSNFYARRARRLFPALFLTFILCFIAAFFLFTAEHFERFGGELLYAMLSLSNIFFWSESGYFNTLDDFKPLLHTWSLSVEEQFYLIWPVTLLFLFRRNSGKRIVLIALGIIAVSSLYANLIFQNGWHAKFLDHYPWLKAHFSDGSSTIFYLTPFRLFEFAIGALIVFIRPYIKYNRIALEITMAAGLTMIAFAIFHFDSTTIFPSYNALIPCIGAALVIFSAAAPTTGFLVRNRISIFIGLISYSVYLVHWPLFVFYKYWRVFPITVEERIILIAASVAIGYLFYRFIETPFRNSGKPTSKRLSPAGVGFTCASLLLLMSLFTATVWAKNGFPWRIPPLPAEVAAQLKNSKQFHIDNFGGAGFPIPTTWINENAHNNADMVVIGDSHAEMFKTGFKNEIGPLNKSIFFSTISCLTLPGLTRLTHNADFNKICPSTLMDALNVLKTSPNATVLLSEAWVEQIKLAGSLDNGKPLYINNDMDGALNKLIFYLDALRAAIGKRQLIIVGDVPGAGVNDIAGCFRRPGYLKVNCNKVLSTLEIGNPSLKVNSFLKKYADQHKNVTFLDPFDALCDGVRCFALKNNRILYSDKAHLSKFGSTFLIGFFKNALMSRINNQTTQLAHNNK